MEDIKNNSRNNSDVFISYRRNRGFMFANYICDYLTENSIDVFLDKKQLMEYTGEYRKEILEAVSNCKIFILIMTKGCFSEKADADKINEKPLYYEEIETALNCNKIIIPIACGLYEKPHESEITAGEYEVVNRLLSLESVKLDKQTYGTVFRETLKAKLSSLANKWRDKNTLLQRRKDVDRKYPLSEWLTDAVEIKVCCTACRGLYREPNLLNKLQQNNCEMKFIMVNPKSQAANDVCQTSKTICPEKTKKMLIKPAYEEMISWASQYTKAQCRVTDYHLMYSLFIVRKKDGSAFAKVDFYAFNTDDSNRRSVMISDSDSENFAFFCEQFDWLWEQSKTVKK